MTASTTSRTENTADDTAEKRTGAFTVGDLVRNPYGDIGIVKSAPPKTFAIHWTLERSDRSIDPFAGLTRVAVHELDSVQRALAFNALNTVLVELAAKHDQAMMSIRDRVIAKFDEVGDICRSGLVEFLEEFDMPMPLKDYRVRANIYLRATRDLRDEVHTDIVNALSAISDDPAVEVNSIDVMEVLADD